MNISFSCLGYFNGYCILLPWIFQWIFHFHPWDISLNLLGSMWDDGHMTNYQNWPKDQSCSPVLYLPESV